MNDWLEDRIKGVIFGHAIGDALGFGAEFMSKEEVEAKYPTGLKSYSQIKLDGMLALHTPGKWTDDTTQMLCILVSLLEKRRVHLKDIARKFYRWLIDDGFGVGFTVSSVLGHPNYVMTPQKVALEVWEKSGRYAAANGALMRTSVLGIWDYNKPEIVKRQAIEVAKLTHADPRCLASCASYCISISSLLRRQFDVEHLFAEAVEVATAIEADSKEFLLRSRAPEIGSLDLACSSTKGEGIGYTYLALAAAYWALLHAQSYEDGLLAIINEGGDADTNGAIAGALLGAKFGFENIPAHLTEGLVNHRSLMSDCEELITLMATRE